MTVSSTVLMITDRKSGDGVVNESAVKFRTVIEVALAERER